MHKVTVKGILSATNGMNLYRGCTHGCIYCDSRSKCYQMQHDFEDIEVKSNGPELLAQSLSRKRKKCMIGTGAMTDPYIPLELELKNMGRCLEIIEGYGFGVTIQTKSSRILRDLDLLKRIDQKAKCVVQMTMTTYNEELCKVLEPNVSTTKERFETLMTLRESGIPTVVWLSPILPFINDTEENLRGILDYCIRAGVYGIICFGMGVTLREGNREYFYRKLDEYFPGMKQRYMREYGYAYELNSPNHEALMQTFYRVCAENNMESNVNRLFQYLHQFEEREQTEQLIMQI